MWVGLCLSDRGRSNRIASGGSEGVAGSSHLILISPSLKLPVMISWAGQDQLSRPTVRVMLHPPHHTTRLRHQKRHGTSVHQACTAPAPPRGNHALLVCTRAPQRLESGRGHHTVSWRAWMPSAQPLAAFCSPEVGILIPGWWAAF